MFWFTLTGPDGDDQVVEADSRAVLEWEETSSSDETYVMLTARNVRSMRMYYRLAWIAAKRTEVFPGSLKDFKEQYQLDVHTSDPSKPVASGEEEGPTPTHAGVSNET